MEKSARKVLSEVLAHFSTSDKKRGKDIDGGRIVQEKNSQKIDVMSSLISKLQTVSSEVPNLKTAIHVER